MSTADRSGLRLVVTLGVAAFVTWLTFSHPTAWLDGFGMGAVVVNSAHVLINWNEPKRVRNDR